MPHAAAVTPPGQVDTFDALLRWSATTHPDRLAFSDARRRLTFAELDNQVDQCAKALMAAGVGKGDRVAIWMTNRVEWIEMFFALARLGAVAVPVNTALTVVEATYLLEQADVSMIIAGGSVRSSSPSASAAELVAASGLTVSVVSLEDDIGGTTPLVDLLRAAAEVSDERLSAAARQVSPDDVVTILYTSGTTGFPKGVMQPQRLVRNMRTVAARLQITSDDTAVLYLPVFHIFALAAAATFLTVGGHIHFMETYSAGGSLEVLESERATVMYGVPAHYYDQLHDPRFPGTDLSRVRLCIAPGPASLIEEVDRQIATAVNCYGMTETTSMTTLGDPAAPLSVRATTIGRPLPLSEIRVVDDAGTEVGPGGAGEILVRGQAVMLGYYRNAAATGKALRDGWFHTGDRVELTESGELRFLGRVDETIKTGGENVDPMEVEAVLMAHPEISGASVIGVPDPRLGEVGLAHVTTYSGEPVDAEELRNFARARLARFKVPRIYVHLTQLPTTASGKVRKVELRASYAASGHRLSD